MDGVAVWLGIPELKRIEMRQKNANKRGHCREVASYYVAHVPGASWLGVAHALWYREDYAPLESVGKLYLRGKTYGSCRSVKLQLIEQYFVNAVLLPCRFRSLPIAQWYVTE